MRLLCCLVACNNNQFFQCVFFVATHLCRIALNYSKRFFRSDTSILVYPKTSGSCMNKCCTCSIAALLILFLPLIKLHSTSLVFLL